MNCASFDEVEIGISPCPNDTYIFHALLHGLVRPDYPRTIKLACRLADVEKLNGWAMAGELPLTKLSVGVLPFALDKYAVLASGAALGWGCGPLVVALDANVDMKTARVALPGRHTTASLLLDLHGGFAGPRREMLFSDIMPAVAAGQADVGVIIHEGRFTYGRHGLVKLLDLGQWWEDAYGLPLPLGAIAVRRDVEPGLAVAMEEAIAGSLEHARARPEDSAAFIRANAQELDEDVTAAHIAAFVTDYSLDLGRQGREAIAWLVNAARKGRPMSEKDIFLR